MENTHLPSIFEGAEKKLEIEFQPPHLWPSAIDTVMLPLNNHSTPPSLPSSKHPNPIGFRGFPRSTWDSILSEIGAAIISSISNQFCDAYVLSESSLFVYPYKIILKTCGETVLLRCLKSVLELATSLNLVVESVWYSRKNFQFQQQQSFPHQSFNQEVEYLSKFFNGSSFILGPTNCAHYYIFMADYSNRAFEPDRTLEIMMTGLDQSFCKSFSYEDSGKLSPDQWKEMSGRSRRQFANQITQEAHLSSIQPTETIDPYVFYPCGYSSNTLSDKSYYTIHITPEHGCSYASFETNVSRKNYFKIINSVIDLFKPKNALIVYFTENFKDSVLDPSILNSYDLVNTQRLRINNESSLQFFSIKKPCDKPPSLPQMARELNYLPLTKYRHLLGAAAIVPSVQSTPTCTPSPSPPLSPLINGEGYCEDASQPSVS